MPTTRIGALESGRFVGRQGTFVGVGMSPNSEFDTFLCRTPLIEDGGDDLSSFVRSALPKIEEFVRIKLENHPQ